VKAGNKLITGYRNRGCEQKIQKSWEKGFRFLTLTKGAKGGKSSIVDPF
jgi:hypothetical protein